MPEKNEKLVIDNERKPGANGAMGAPVVSVRPYDPQNDALNTETTKLSIPPQAKVLPPMIETPRQLPATYIKKAPGRERTTGMSARERANVRLVQEQCQRLCLTLFTRKQERIRSLGFTSAIGGEGKTFLSVVTARILARDSLEPITLIECNWEHPTLHEQFDIPATPGLAEWLKGLCSEQDIRYQVAENLTIIPAGEGAADAAKLLKQVQQRGLWQMFKQPSGLLIVDLPPVITSSYGSLAAELVDTAIIVVRSEVIPGRVLAETCALLKDAFVHGVILNQEASRIPRWVRQLL